MTPLIVSVINGHEDVVRLLLKEGADLEAKFDGSTALIEAAVQGRDGVVRLLLQHGAEKEAKSKDGYTALHVAAANAYVKVVQCLLDAGAEVNAKDNKQITPLMSAAICNKLWMVELLLIRGADVQAKDKDGETALDLHQNKEAAKMLALRELYDRRNTPIAKLLKAEMDRRRRSWRREPYILNSYLSLPRTDRATRSETTASQISSNSSVLSSNSGDPIRSSFSDMPGDLSDDQANKAWMDEILSKAFHKSDFLGSEDN
jgi:ankyrin repeat protein